LEIHRGGISNPWKTRPVISPSSSVAGEEARLAVGGLTSPWNRQHDGGMSGELP
jgi:hypothetical protein